MVMFKSARIRLLAVRGVLFVAAAIGAGTLPVAAQNYYAMSCDDLWYARNAIYAEKGYCFKTPRAQAVFGPRCYPPYGQLSPYEQQQVSAITQTERAKGCR